MTYRIAFDEEPGLLVARVRGERPDLDADAGIEAAQGWRAIAEEARGRGVGRILLLVDVQGEPTSSNAQLQAGLMATFGFERLPLRFFLVLALMVAAYLALVEAAKAWFYRSVVHEAGRGFPERDVASRRTRRIHRRASRWSHGGSLPETAAKQ